MIWGIIPHILSKNSLLSKRVILKYSYRHCKKDEGGKRRVFIPLKFNTQLSIWNILNQKLQLECRILHYITAKKPGPLKKIGTQNISKPWATLLSRSSTTPKAVTVVGTSCWLDSISRKHSIFLLDFLLQGASKAHATILLMLSSLVWDTVVMLE